MIKQAIKAITPEPVRAKIRSLRKRVRDRGEMRKLRDVARAAPGLHAGLLARHRGARPIRVLFLMSNTASWKVGPVFEQMLADPDFEPLAALCPTTSGMLASAAKATADLARSYLQEAGVPFVDLVELDVAQGRAEIEKFDPHLVFFTNPHRLVPAFLHDEILKSRLTCYVPYSHEVMAYGDNQEQHNQLSHNAFWRVFVPHEESRSFYKTSRIRGDDGVMVTGFPACEPLLVAATPRDPSPWKAQVRPKKRIIYAPHWLWRPDIKMATIDSFGEVMQQLAATYCDEVQWALRPHPMLKPRLLASPDWGVERTNSFFEFWERSDFSQIHDDDYVPLFLTSDAIIHDSGSFLAEYLYLRKPAMYLMTDQTGAQYFNDFGKRAIASCQVGRSAEDIERFVQAVIRRDPSAGADAESGFFQDEIAPLLEVAPSMKICSEIKNAFA